MTTDLPLTNDAEIGPAMQALSEHQRRFVRAMIDLGRGGIQNYKKAAEIAGYSASSSGYLRRIGCELAHDPRIQAALLEEAKRSINLAAASIATPVVAQIALDRSVKPQDRLRACEMLFNRGGMPALTEHKVTVDHTASSERMVALAKRMAAELGVDPARLIGVNRDAAEAIDAEFTVVSDDRAADA